MSDIVSKDEFEKACRNKISKVEDMLTASIGMAGLSDKLAITKYSADENKIRYLADRWNLRAHLDHKNGTIFYVMLDYSEWEKPGDQKETRPGSLAFDHESDPSEISQALLAFMLEELLPEDKDLLEQYLIQDRGHDPAQTP